MKEGNMATPRPRPKRYDVQITVKSVTKGACPQGFKPGDTWLVKSKTPDGMCLGAFGALYSTLSLLRFGGERPYDEDRDVLTLGTYQGWGFKEAISIYRPYGNVGLGGRYAGSTYKLYVYGRAYCTGGSWEASDKRFKVDIKEVSAEAAKLKKLKGVSYKKKDIHSMLDSLSSNSEGKVTDYVSVDTVVLDKKDSVKHKKAIVPERSYGFIAQEVREIYPDLVLEDETGYLAVNYTGFIPIIVESLNEQQEVVDSLKKDNHNKQTKLDNLSSEIALLKEQMALLESKLTECCSGNKEKSAGLTAEGNDIGVVLYQNKPNPFSGNTQVNFYLPEKVQDAILCVYDMNGVQLKCYPLSQRGEGSIVISGGELKAGMYMYSLIIDGQLVDTKRMVLTD